MNIRQLFTVLCIIASAQIFAQIVAPDFDCVRNDSLFWSAPTLNCGTMITGYEIYGSPDLNTPFTLIATVNSTDRNFFFINPANQIQFFYLSTLADCPGQMGLPSDTLNNRPPSEIPIISASVVNGQTVLTWPPSPEPNVIEYIVFRRTAIGTIPIDTVTTATYTDLTGAPNTVSEVYSVNAVDQCGNISFFDDAHNTILASLEEDPCGQLINLSWNAYQNWPNGVGLYEILVSEDSGLERIVDTVAGDVTTYALQNVLRGINYDITIRAKENATSAESRSNTLSIVPDVVEAVNPFVLFNAGVLSNDQVRLQWYWDGDIDPASIIVTYRPCGGAASVNQPISLTNIDSNWQETILTGLTTDNCSYTFVITANNTCGLPFSTGPISTHFLTGEAFDNSATLNWEFSNDSINRQDIFSADSMPFNQLAPFGTTTSTYTDVWIVDQLTYCYVVEASGSVLIANELVEFIQSSNIVCVNRSLNVYLPTAFSPNGVNRVFQPYFNNVNLISEYQLDVYDRWGGKLFSTKSPFQPWNGQSNLKFSNPGEYVVQLSIKTIGGQEINRVQSLFLLD